MDGAPERGKLLTDRIGTRPDDTEFEFLFLEHYARVRQLLFRLTGNRAQAEELSNEVFWRLSRQPKSWLLTNNVGPWLYRIAVNTGIDAFRAATRRARNERNAAREAGHKLSEGDPLDTLLRQESRARVQCVLAGMKPARAQLLLLRSCGASYKEIGESLGLSVGSVGTLLNRAEAEFRKRYLALMVKEKA